MKNKLRELLITSSCSSIAGLVLTSSCCLSLRKPVSAPDKPVCPLCYSGLWFLWHVVKKTPFWKSDMIVASCSIQTRAGTAGEQQPGAADIRFRNGLKGRLLVLRSLFNRIKWAVLIIHTHPVRFLVTSPQRRKDYVHQATVALKEDGHMRNPC